MSCTLPTFFVNILTCIPLSLELFSTQADPGEQQNKLNRLELIPILAHLAYIANG